MPLPRLFRSPAPQPVEVATASREPTTGSGAVAPTPGGAPAAVPAAPSADTETIRRIVAQLDALTVEQRRFIGGFAYVLGRTANADLDITPQEISFMERAVIEVGGLTEAQAVLVVEITRSQAELQGATEDYLVTREFAAAASLEDRQKLLRLAFSIGAVDDSISAEESAEINEIGKELGFTPAEVDAVRVEFADKLSVIQQMRRLQQS